MSAFFDTNILIYAQQEGIKPEAARKVMSLGGTVSIQVLNEFAAVCRRKMRHGWTEIEEAIEDVLALVARPVPLTIETHRAALALARDHNLSFYDALIVASALEASCDTLYSEDLQNGRAIGGLTIRNPFIETAP